MTRDGSSSTARGTALVRQELLEAKVVVTFDSSSSASTCLALSSTRLPSLLLPLAGKTAHEGIFPRHKELYAFYTSDGAVCLCQV